MKSEPVERVPANDTRVVDVKNDATARATLKVFVEYASKVDRKCRINRRIKCASESKRTKGGLMKN